MVWTEHTMPVTHALTAQGTLVNEVSWLPARSFQSDNNGAMSYALVKLPPPPIFGFTQLPTARQQCDKSCRHF